MHDEAPGLPRLFRPVVLNQLPAISAESYGDAQLNVAGRCWSYLRFVWRNETAALSTNSVRSMRQSLVTILDRADGHVSHRKQPSRFEPKFSPLYSIFGQCHQPLDLNEDL